MAPTGPLSTSSSDIHWGFHVSSGEIPLALVSTNPSISMCTLRTANGARIPLLLICSRRDPPKPRVSMRTPGSEFNASSRSGDFPF